MNDEISPAQKARSVEMYKNFFSLVSMHPEAGVKRCNIDGANLYHALSTPSAWPPACDVMMVRLNNSNMGNIADSCPPEKFAGVKVLAFSGQQSMGAGKRLEVTDHFIEWLRDLPVDHIAFNDKGFAPISLQKLRTDPDLRGKVVLVDDTLQLDITRHRI